MQQFPETARITEPENLCLHLTNYYLHFRDTQGEGHFLKPCAPHCSHAAT